MSNLKRVLRRFSRARGHINTRAIVYEGQLKTAFAAKIGAPVGKKGPGPHGRIPKSLKSPAPTFTVDDAGGRTDKAEVYSLYGPAVFTNEGTGKHGMRRSPYPIRRGDMTFMHPGIKGNQWFGVAFAEGSELVQRRMHEVMDEVGDILSGGM